MVIRRQLRCLTAVAQSLQSPNTLTISSLRCLHARIDRPPVPVPTPFVPDVQTFLTLIGRELSQHSSKFDSWETLFSLKSPQLKELGVEPARNRRYLINWLNRFRYGEHGIGGDLKHVKDGVGYIRICSVHADSEIAGRVWDKVHGTGSSNDGIERTKASNIPATANCDAGHRLVLLNIPVGNLPPLEDTKQQTSEDNASPEEASQDIEAVEKLRFADALLRTLSDAEYAKAEPVRGFKIHKSGKGIMGAECDMVVGTHGEVAKIKVREGLWEHRRGHKVDGGERRKAAVRAKRRAAEAKA